MGMAKEPTRSNVVAIIVGIGIGAIGGLLIGLFGKMWLAGIGFTIGFAILWIIIQRTWEGRVEKEIEDPYEGR
jgi:membrane protein implicated in regulation of membrane protease activity